jgi:hypothetical protein
MSPPNYCAHVYVQYSKNEKLKVSNFKLHHLFILGTDQEPLNTRGSEVHGNHLGLQVWLTKHILHHIVLIEVGLSSVVGTL